MGTQGIFSVSSYVENPFEGAQITGLTLEILSREILPLNLLNPLAKHASKVIAGLMERNPQGVTQPDVLYKEIFHQLLREAELVLLLDAGVISDRFTIEDTKKSEIRDISRTTLEVIAAYNIRLIESKDEVATSYLPEAIEFWGKNLINFNLFSNMFIPFFEPGQVIKKRLSENIQLLENLGIEKMDIFTETINFPSVIIFDDNGRYKVVLCTLDYPHAKVLITEENVASNMGLRTIQYLLRTKSSFEELTKDFGLSTLPELNSSIPLNTVLPLREKKGRLIIDHQLLTNISLGAV
jgi:hypothetical protein